MPPRRRQNTLLTIERAGTYEPPVYVGGEKCFFKGAGLFAYETHGMDGMGDLGLKPERLLPAEGNGVLCMLDALRNSEKGEIDLVTLGPLTNLALAIAWIRRRCGKKPDAVTVMGGRRFRRRKCDGRGGV